MHCIISEYSILYFNTIMIYFINGFKFIWTFITGIQFIYVRMKLIISCLKKRIYQKHSEINKALAPWFLLVEVIHFHCIYCIYIRNVLIIIRHVVQIIKSYFYIYNKFFIIYYVIKIFKCQIAHTKYILLVHCTGQFKWNKKK